MKQTSSALTFLLAQYRAIFKRAYIKGIASAVILTAGLAAGQAQADPAPNGPYWSTADDLTWTENTEALKTFKNSKRIVGDYDDGTTTGHKDGSVSGETLVIGSAAAGGDFTGINSGSVYGGYVSLGDDKTMNALAEGNYLYVKSGGTLNTTGNIVGGWAKTKGSGFATATDNHLIIEKDAILTNAGQFIGAVAAGNNGALAKGNSFTFSGDAAAPEALTNNGNFGATVFVGDATKGKEKEATKGTFEALGNTLKLSNFSVTDAAATTAKKTFIGGNIQVLKAAENNSITLRAQGNTVDLSNFTIGNAAYTEDAVNGNVANIAANYVVNNETTKHAVELVEANGSGDTGVILNNGDIFGASVYGGFAQNVSGGAATASNNVVSITNTDLFVSTSGSAASQKYIMNAVTGGHAESTYTTAGQQVNLTASNNVVSIVNDENDKAKTPHTMQGTVYGAKLTLTSGSGITNFVGATLTADGNQVTIGEGIDVIDGSVYAAYLASNVGTTPTESGGATLHASNNIVTIDGSWTFSENASIATVAAEAGMLTAENNKLDLNGKVNGGGAVIAAVISSAQPEISGTLEDPGNHQLSNNSVEIGANAEIENANIYAAQSLAHSAYTLNNDVTVAGKVTNSDIYGGTGADSLVDVKAGSHLTYNDGAAGPGSGSNHTISSDVVNLDGIVSVGQYATLQVKGYGKNGMNNAGTYNTNQTTVGSTAEIYNHNVVEFLGATTVEAGAKLHALAEGAKLKVNGDSTAVTTADDLKVGLVGGRGQLTISKAQLKSYLTSGDSYTLDSTTSGTDKAGTVEVTSGGVLEFTDQSVVLSNFDFVKGAAAAAQAGKILVDNDATKSGSIFKANELTVEHAFASNATTYQGKHEDLADIGANGIILQANTLNLGAAGLNSSESAQIDFDHALVKENINFLAATSGEDTGTGDINTGYHLSTQVIGSNFMKTNDQNSKLDYYTALDGNVNGQVKIVSGGSLEIVDGHWTAHDQITVASGGSLVVGGTSKADPLTNGNNSLPDATLTTSGVVLDVTVDGGEATVKADGDGHQSSVEAGDNRDVILDLTSGLTMRGDTSGKTEAIKGKATIDATSAGIVRLDATDVNTILGQNHRNGVDSGNGAFLSASSNGVLQVDGEVNAAFRDFDGDSGTNGFNLASDGILDVTTLNVENANVKPAAGSSYQEDAAYIASSAPIEFVGTVRADDVLLNDLQLTVKSGGSTSYASQVKVGSGTLEVAKSLSSVNDTVIFGNASGAAHLVLTSDVVGDEGTVDVNTLRVDSGSITVKNGVWTAQDITLSGAGTGLTVGGDTGVDQNGNDTEASLTFNHLTMGQGSEFKVEADGKATVNTVDLSTLDATDAVSVAGELTIIGASVSGDTTNGVHFSKTAGSISIENNGSLRFDKLATNGAILADGDYTGTTINLQKGYTQIANNGGELYLNFDSGSSFDDEAIIAFKHALFTADSFADGMLKNGGILNIGAASFEGFNITERLEGTGLDGYTATWQQVKDFSDIYGNDVTNDVKNITNIRAIGLIDQVKGSWGSLSMDSGVATGAQVDIAGNTWLNYAAGNNGFFISNHDHSAALGAKVASQKTLTLLSGGAIGHITLENGRDDVDRNYTTLDIADGDTTIESITASNENATGTYATRVNVRSNTTVTGEDGIRDVGEVNVLNGATLTSTQADIQELWVEESTADISGTLTVNGDGTAEGDGEALALGGQIKAGSIVLEDGSELNAAHGGTITTESVTVANNSTGSTIQVGFDIDTITDIISEEHENSYYTGTGYLEVSKYLDLNGASLVVDPAYDEATSVAAVMNFKNGQDKTYDTVFNDVGIVNGQVLVGKNAALGIGATLAETREAIATYQNNGALDANKYGSILYLNGQLTLDGNSEIALNSDANVKTLDGIRDSLKYTITSQVQDQYADLGLGKNTAILMTEAAFENEKGEKTGVAISFDRTNAVVNGQGGDIVLVGAFDASQTLNFFKDKDGEGHEGAYIAGQDIKVYTQNGFLYTTLKAGTEDGYGKVLHVDTDRAFQVMSEASDPVVNTLISYHEDRLPADSTSGNDAGTDNGSNAGTEGGEQTVAWTEIKDTATKTAQAETKETTEQTPIEPPANTAPTTKVTGSSSFLNEVVTASHGAPAEQAARLAVYGGAAQVGLAAAGSNSDVLESRFGIGANAQSLNLASNGMGGTLWVAPIYKSQDSDGFGAQGLEYGVDFDLYGVALGGDYKVTNEITVGAMFNVGSGSLDGQGNAAAAGTSNDFDYFGFALYGAYQAGALTVTGDLSYTQVDNDLEGSNEVGKLTASSDTSAWSLGVTGQYAFSFASIDVTPHAGLRFTSLDLDDYSLEAAGYGNVANYDGDTLSVFSIPVGVTFAKTIEGESWNVTPALDLHVTGQFGDDEAEGSVAWTGTNLSTNVSSEIFDSFTYGATVGIQAESNSFSFGVGVGYTGSSNVDEFSAQANARFTF